jgi:hypothetical protein
MILDAGCQLHLTDNLVPRTEAAVPTSCEVQRVPMLFRPTANMYASLVRICSLCPQGDPCRGSKPSAGVCHQQAGVEPPMGGVKARYPKRTLREQEHNYAHTTSAASPIITLFQ